MNKVLANKTAERKAEAIEKLIKEIEKSNLNRETKDKAIREFGTSPR